MTDNLSIDLAPDDLGEVPSMDLDGLQTKTLAGTLSTYGLVEVYHHPDEGWNGRLTFYDGTMSPVGVRGRDDLDDLIRHLFERMHARLEMIDPR